MFNRLYRQEVRSHSQAPLPRRRIQRARHRCVRLHLEMLEPRLAPANHVWSGAASGLWSDGMNWSSGGTPVGDPNADLIFPSTGVTRFTSTDDLASGTTIHSIAFLGDGYYLKPLPLHRNAITLTGDIAMDMVVSGRNTIALDLLLPATGDHTITVVTEGSLSLEGIIQGGADAVTIIKAGTGELTLANYLNSYRGATSINNGTLRLVGPTAIPQTSDVTVAAGAVFDLNDNHTDAGSLSGEGHVFLGASGAGALFVGFNNRSTSFSGVIDGAGILQKHGTGVLTLSGQDSSQGLRLTAATFLVSGTLRLAADDVLSHDSIMFMYRDGTLDLDGHTATVLALARGQEEQSSGPVLLGTGGILHVGAGFALGYDGVISGDGGQVIHDLPGIQTLTGNSTYTGATMVSVGTLVIKNGSLSSSSAVTASGSGALSGTGTVGPLTVNSGGTVSPGIPVQPPDVPSHVTGILHSGNVMFNAGSTFTVSLNGTDAGTGYDQMSVTGMVDLSGNPNLNVSLGFAPAAGQTFTIFTSTGGLTGNFNGLPEGSTFTVGAVTFQINYTANVVLTAITGADGPASPQHPGATLALALANPKSAPSGPAGEGILPGPEAGHASAGGAIASQDAVVFFGDAKLQLRDSGVPEPGAFATIGKGRAAALDLLFGSLAPDTYGANPAIGSVSEI